jgi:DNA replication protein DnaC
MKVRRSIWKMEKSGLKNVIKEMTFERFQVTEPWQENVKARAMAYADSMEGWLLFCGQVGSGKSHLCTAVCRHRLLNGDEVRYMPWRDDIAQLKALSLDNEKREKYIADLKTAQILYIDDLYKTGKAADGSSNPTSADVSIAFEIINYRYINHLPTIVSTEKTPQELIEIDEATASRIIERAKGYTIQISRNPGRNYRLRDVVEV